MMQAGREPAQGGRGMTRILKREAAKGAGGVWLAGLWLAAFAALSRAASLGDLAYFNDEYFYWEAGLRLHQGLLPYVGVWDRKGPGLFLVYGLITGVSGSVEAFQLAAGGAAALTALVLWALARRMMGQAGALLAGTAYLAALPMFGGAGGQSPVFYNLAMAGAVWCVVSAREALRAGALPGRLWGAMGLAGFALTFKQSATPEAAFLGLYALWQMRGQGAARLLGRGVLMALAGLAPFALFALGFAAAGHFDAFWQAMFASNLRRAYNLSDALLRIRALAISGSPLLVLAAAGLGLAGRGWRGFVAGWLVAAVVGFALPPNFYHHYMLPLLLPVSLAAGFAMDRRPWGMVAGAVAAWILLTASGALDFARPQHSRAQIEGLVAEIRAHHPAPRVLVYEGPMALYGLLGVYPPSPLLDNFHLYFPFENNVSPFDTAAETRRDLAWRPNVVLTYHNWPATEENPRSAALVHAYLRQCRLWRTLTYAEAVQSVSVDVWGDCVSGSAARIPMPDAPAQGLH